MSRDFQQTHENLLACAKKHFLENGFERASIREICLIFTRIILII